MLKKRIAYKISDICYKQCNYYYDKKRGYVNTYIPWYYRPLYNFGKLLVKNL